VRYYMAVEREDTGEVIGDAGFEWTNPVEREGDCGIAGIASWAASVRGWATMSRGRGHEGGHRCRRAFML